MNIVFSIDDRFSQHCAVTMMSVMAHNKNCEFFILTTGLSKSNTALLMDMVSNNGSKLQIVNVDSEAIKDFPMPKTQGSHISIATYFRLFVERLLPKHVDKVLYLDSDIVVRSKIDELWETNMEDGALGAVYQHTDWALSNKSFERLGIKREQGYFNAGVLLINLEYWRKNQVTEKLFSFINNNYENIRSHDQDVLNAVLGDKTIALDCKWNLLNLFFSQDVSKYEFPSHIHYLTDLGNTIKNPVIVHFVFVPKPWDYGCSHPYKNDYYSYLDLTPWKGFRPKFNLRSYYKYVLFPFLNRNRKFILKKLSLCKRDRIKTKE